MSNSTITENRKKLFHRLLVCISLIWLVMILGISFLGAPLKFMVPGPTFETGLGIGRQVFGVFNKVEWAMAITMAILIVIVRQMDRRVIPLVVVWSSLALQTFWRCYRFYLTEYKKPGTGLIYCVS